jgi:GxxExxY protein
MASHTEFRTGPFLEHIYKAALERELRARGHLVRREVYVLVIYKGEQIGRQRIDMIVDDRVIVEVKSTRLLSPEASRQLYNYLHATTINVGLLLHFGPKANYERSVCTTRRTGER